MIYENIVIVGGGIAGSLAAVAAGRKCEKVLLIEETGCLGGSMTSSGTGPMMTFHAGETQVIRGLTEELVSRLVDKGLSPGHTIDSTGYTYTVTPFDAEGLKRELEIMVLESGARILYHTMLSGCILEGDKLSSIDVVSCGEHIQIKAEIYIDATGDGDMLKMAGVPFVQGRKSDGLDQPMTMNFKLEGVDIESIRDLMSEQPQLFPFLESKAGIEKHASRLSCSGFQSIMKKGIADGSISFDRDIVLFFETNTAQEVIVNMTRVNGDNPVDPFSLSHAETEGRRQVWELYSFLVSNVPGFEHAKLISSGPNIGIRSSRRMVGAYTLTANDIMEGRVFPDRIVAFGYPIDIHSSDGAETDSRFLAYGQYYTIPYRVLYNNVITNLMAAGRCVSCTFEAHASLRLSPCCGALGQACGIAASMAVSAGCQPAQIDITELQNNLEEEQAFIG